MQSDDATQLVQLVRRARLVDLSVTTGVDLPCSPPEGQPPAQFLLNTYTWPRGPFLEYVQVHDDHTGTHIDAAPEGERTNLAASPVITAELLADWEREHGELEPGEVVLFRTGWSDRYYRPLPDGFRYDRSHPAPGADAIAHLHQRGIRHIGIDVRGIGLMQDDNTPHWAALGRGIVATENLTNLGELPARGALFLFLPHKFAGATGGLGRAIALVL